MQKYKKILSAVCLAALCLLMPLQTACKDKDSSNDADASVYIVPVPENKVDLDESGTETEMKLGETYVYQDKVSVTMNAVREIDLQASLSRRILLCEITIENQSTETLPISFATHFSTRIDGEMNKQPVLSTANQQANKYYGNDERMIHQDLLAGQKLEGTIALSLPPNWNTLELVYYPYFYYSNDFIAMEIDADEIIHIQGDGASTAPES